MPSRDQTIATHQDTLRRIADDLDRIDILGDLEYSEQEFEEAAAITSYLAGWKEHLEETAKIVLRELVRLNPEL